MAVHPLLARLAWKGRSQTSSAALSACTTDCSVVPALEPLAPLGQVRVSYGGSAWVGPDGAQFPTWFVPARDSLLPPCRRLPRRCASPVPTCGTSIQSRSNSRTNEICAEMHSHGVRFGEAGAVTDFSSRRFPILFPNRSTTTDLASEIQRIDVAALCREYDQLRKAAPSRSARNKRYFVGHDGRPRAKNPASPSEKHLAIALWRLKAQWPRAGGGWLRLLDYQFPLKARSGKSEERLPHRTRNYHDRRTAVLHVQSQLRPRDVPPDTARGGGGCRIRIHHPMNRTRGIMKQETCRGGDAPERGGWRSRSARRGRCRWGGCRARSDEAG